jgi:ParB/RepB/Spo0J family partition protein
VSRRAVAAPEAAPAAPDTHSAQTGVFALIALKDLHASETNPRREFNQLELEELATSIGRQGVLQPIVVRRDSKGYEIVCGERRFRAAQLARLEEIPAMVRDLADLDVLEIQLVENLQRRDLGALEEAEGYRQLMKTGKYDAKRIASKIGRSEKYVYDRIKLLELTPEAKNLLGEGKITAGHAILLARLKPADQARALEDGTFEHEELLFGPDERGGDEIDPHKPRSVRELAGWIDKHVRFEPTAPDPMLFPETASAIEEAASSKNKIIPITWSDYVDPQARTKERLYFPRSWKRADGEIYDDPTRHGKPAKSKTCERSGLGVVVAGWHRGESFLVCVSKACEIHWPAQAKRGAEKAKAAAEGKPAPAAVPSWQLEQKRREEAQAKAEARFKAALPELTRKTKEAIARASVAPGGALAKIILHEMRISHSIPGRSAEDFMRGAVTRTIGSHIVNRYSHEAALREMKLLGVDVAKIVAAANRSAEPAEKKPARKKAKK